MRGTLVWGGNYYALPPVHPRACGEHSAETILIAKMTGSSPRMRGTPVAAPDERIAGRFIPAHAGNTPMAGP